MTYIGQQPSTTFDSGIQDRFTGLTTNTVTLTHDISAETDILVVWNNIVQDSSTYSVGGAGNKTLTLGGTLSSGDVVTCYYTNKVMQSVNPTANSVGVTELNLSDGSNGQAITTNGSGTLAFATVGGNNTPSFSAKLSSDQSASSGAETVLAFATEQWDSDSKFASNKFTPTVAGKYVINGMIMLNDITVQNKRLQLLIYKNGSFFADVETIASSETSTDPTLSINLLMEFNTSDYVELRFYHNVGSTVTVRSGYSFFQGYKLIGA